MDQYFSHYLTWEDFQNGMFEMSDVADKDIKIIGAIDLLKNPDEFYKVCKIIIDKWPVSSKVNLSNLAQNRRAWLGAAACCFKYSTPEYLTRIAWSLLEKDSQDNANSAADRVIKEFETLTKSNYAKTLFDS